MTFKDCEKRRYEALKTELFSSCACAPGLYRNWPRTFCLHREYSKENLFEKFREDAVAYFRDRGIRWHDGYASGHGAAGDLPSNHLCCSQCACVNSLWPMTRHPDLLLHAFSPFLPDLAQVLPFAKDDPLPGGETPYLAFEWIGTRNYLGEVGNRTRGANATSADFAFRCRRHDGRIALVLGEWKYTESYLRRKPASERVTAVRQGIYRAAFNRWRATGSKLPPYESLFVEPFYQLMRLTLLALEMEAAAADGAGEMCADVVSVILVAPEANHEYASSFTSSAMREFGDTVQEAWESVAPRGRFTWIPTEHLLTAIERAAPESLHDWAAYLMTRYAWWQGGSKR